MSEQTPEPTEAETSTEREAAPEPSVEPARDQAGEPVTAGQPDEPTAPEAADSMTGEAADSAADEAADSAADEAADSTTGEDSRPSGSAGGTWRRWLAVGLGVAAIAGVAAWYVGTRGGSGSTAPKPSDETTEVARAADEDERAIDAAPAPVDPVPALESRDAGVPAYIPRCDENGHSVVAEGTWYGPLLASESRLFWRQVGGVVWTVPKGGGVPVEVACNEKGRSKCSKELLAVDDNHAYWIDDVEYTTLTRTTFTEAGYPTNRLHGPASGVIQFADRTGLVWGEKGDIVTMSLDGRKTTRWATGMHRIERLTADASHVYWMIAGELWRATRAGADKVRLLERPDDDIGEIAVSDDAVYLASPKAGEIVRVAKSGGPAEVVASKLNRVSRLAIDDEHLYFYASMGIRRMSLRDHKVEQIGDDFLVSKPDAVQVDKDYVYWATYRSDYEEDEYQEGDDYGADEYEDEAAFYDEGVVEEPDPTESEENPMVVMACPKSGGESMEVFDSEYGVLLFSGGANGVYVASDEYETTASQIAGGELTGDSVSIPGRLHDLVGVGDKVYARIETSREDEENGWMNTDMGLFMQALEDDELVATAGSHLPMEHATAGAGKLFGLFSGQLALEVSYAPDANIEVRLLSGDAMPGFEQVSGQQQLLQEMGIHLDPFADTSGVWRQMGHTGKQLIWLGGDGLRGMRLADGWVDPVIRGDMHRPHYLVPAQRDLYWLDGQAIWHKKPGEDSGPEPLREHSWLARALAVHDGFLYWSAGFEIMRTPRGPSVPPVPPVRDKPEVWLTTARVPEDIIVDDGWIYWMTDKGPVMKHPRTREVASDCQGSADPVVAKTSPLPTPVARRVHHELRDRVGAVVDLREIEIARTDDKGHVVFALFEYGAYERCIRTAVRGGGTPTGCLPPVETAADGTDLRPDCMELALARLVFGPAPKGAKRPWSDKVTEVAIHELKSKCTLDMVIDYSLADPDDDSERELIVDVVTEALEPGTFDGEGFESVWEREFHIFDTDTLEPIVSLPMASADMDDEREDLEMCEEGSLEFQDVDGDGHDDIVIESRECRLSSCEYDGLSSTPENDEECTSKDTTHLLYKPAEDTWSDG